MQELEAEAANAEAAKARGESRWRADEPAVEWNIFYKADGSSSC